MTVVTQTLSNEYNTCLWKVNCFREHLGICIGTGGRCFRKLFEPRHVFLKIACAHEKYAVLFNKYWCSYKLADLRTKHNFSYRCRNSNKQWIASLSIWLPESKILILRTWRQGAGCFCWGLRPCDRHSRWWSREGLRRASWGHIGYMGPHGIKVVVRPPKAVDAQFP